MYSKIIKKCQFGCKTKLKDVLFLGYVSSVNNLSQIKKKIVLKFFFH